MNTWRNCFRPLALVVGTGWLVASTGCYSWHAQTRPVGDVIAAAPSSVRVTLKSNGEALELRSPRVATDSLIGFVRFVRETDVEYDSNRVAVPLTGVRRVETRGISAGRTALFVGGTFLGVVAIVGIACSTQDCLNTGYGY